MKRLSGGALSGVLLLHLLSGTAWAQDVRKLASDAAEPDVAKAVDVVIVGDGYAREDESEFFIDARRVAQQTVEHPASAVFRAARPFNFHYAFASSRERGLPFAPGALPRDTVCKGHVRDDAFLVVDDAAAETIAASLAPDVDVVVVLMRFQDGAPPNLRANADVRLGRKGRIRLPRRSAYALPHELGHTLFGLGDEYVEFDAAVPEHKKGEIALYPNLTVYPDGQRWRHVTTAVIEGGGTWKRGVYKSETRCCMNESVTPRFCAVCESVIKAPPTKPKDPVPSLGIEEGATLTTEHPITLHWTREPGVPPVRHWITLSYLPPGTLRYEPVWWGGIEGHVLEKALGGLPAGRWAFGVRTEGMTGQSDVKWVEFTVEKSASGFVKDPFALLVPVLPSGVASAPIRSLGILGAMGSEEPRTPR